MDDIAEVLAVADAPGILDRYYQQGQGQRPGCAFLRDLSDAIRSRRARTPGVYYTPEPVVGYIVRSLHGLLKKEFGKGDGLASDGVDVARPGGRYHDLCGSRRPTGRCRV